MARITVITCDNCGEKVEEDAPNVTIGRKPFDFCSSCQFIIIDGFGPKEEGVNEVVSQVMRDLQERERDMQAIRSHLSQAVQEWGEGHDPRPTLTKAMTRAA